jgi:hypothetical protein
VRIKTCLALAGALAVGAASATTLDEQQLGEMAAQAEVAILGKVTGSRTAQTDAGVVTITKVEVLDSLWGAAKGSTLEVTTLGGSVKTAKYPVGRNFPGEVQLFKNSRSVLLLDAGSNGKYTIVGFNQGQMQVVSTPQGDAVTVPGRQLMPLQAAMAQIKNARVAPAKNELAR